MAEQLNPRELVTLEELAVSNMWEIAALVKVLERKGILTDQEVLETIHELRRQIPQVNDLSHLHDPTFLGSDKANILIKHVLDVFNASGLTADQAKDLLRHLEVLVELGQRVASKVSH
jgi:hypothetical protein